MHLDANLDLTIVILSKFWHILQIQLTHCCELTVRNLGVLFLFVLNMQHILLHEIIVNSK